MTLPADVQAAMIYWPALAAFGALVAAVFGAGWAMSAAKRIGINLRATRENKEKLTKARAADKEFDGKVRTRQGEIDKLHGEAGKLFWRHEKSWIG